MNQNQITMTRGDDRTFSIVVDDEYEGDTASFVVDGLLEKTGLTVGADDGSGSSMVTVTIDAEDTEGCGDYRHRHRYALTVTHDGERLTVRRGLFVVAPDVESP